MKENYNESSGWNPHVSIHPQVPLHSVSARSRPTAAESFVERRPSQRRGRCRAEAWRLQPQPSPGDGLQVIHLSLTFLHRFIWLEFFPHSVFAGCPTMGLSLHWSRTGFSSRKKQSSLSIMYDSYHFSHHLCNNNTSLDYVRITFRINS